MGHTGSRVTQGAVCGHTASQGGSRTWITDRLPLRPEPYPGAGGALGQEAYGGVEGEEPCAAVLQLGQAHPPLLAKASAGELDAAGAAEQQVVHALPQGHGLLEGVQTVAGEVQQYNRAY